MSFADRCGLGSAALAARSVACAALLERMGEERLHSLRIGWPDLHGTLRGKTVVLSCDTAEAAARALHDGIGMVGTVLLKDTSDRTAFAVFDPEQRATRPALRGFGAASNLTLLPDPTSFVRLPWAPGTGWLRAEPFFADGSPVGLCPRRALQRALSALQEHTGFGLKCGLELEFHIYRIADARLAASDAAWPAEPPQLELIHPGFKLLAEDLADLAEPALAVVRDTALGLGMPLRSLEIELGPSQVEAVFAPTDALTAADQMALFRSAARQALRRAGFHASFVCKPPLPHAVASGWHLHQSLVRADGSNAFGDEAVLSAWTAGLLAHARGLAAVCAPTVPAYARFDGSPMAPQAAVWGRDNRGAMLRVIDDAGDTSGAGSPDTRIENRIGEPMANPHLAIAAQVWAGLDGLRRGSTAPPPVENPYAASDEPLPRSLADALDVLAADRVLQEGLGDGLADVFDTVKRQELARHAQAEDKLAWERREYLARF